MFVLPKKKEIKISGKTSEVVRVRITTMELIEEMTEESGLSKQEILERVTKYAYENLEWEE